MPYCLSAALYGRCGISILCCMVLVSSSSVLCRQEQHRVPRPATGVLPPVLMSFCASWTRARSAPDCCTLLIRQQHLTSSVYLVQLLEPASALPGVLDCLIQHQAEFCQAAGAFLTSACVCWSSTATAARPVSGSSNAACAWWPPLRPSLVMAGVSQAGGGQHRLWHLQGVAA